MVLKGRELILVGVGVVVWMTMAMSVSLQMTHPNEKKVCWKKVMMNTTVKISVCVAKMNDGRGIFSKTKRQN
jgi:hypothetical protein